MQPRVSILIPTHDRCDVLAQTLQGLRQVRVPAGSSAELVVVANACTDRTEAVVAEAAASMPFPTRCVAEPTVGLSVARNRCVAEATGDVCAFLDDDVLVSPGWLEAVVELYRDYGADAGCGPVELWWEQVERPPWMTPLLEGFLSCRDLGPAVHRADATAPIGANFWFRRAVFDAVGPFRPELGRQGNSLAAAEETEWLTRAERAGFGIYYSPRASLKHWVAPHRLSTRYLGGVAFGTGWSQVLRKAPFGPAQVLRQLVGRGWLVARHAPAEVWAALRRDRGRFLHHHAMRRIGTGGLAGTVHRLFGFSPVKP